MKKTVSGISEEEKCVKPPAVSDPDCRHCNTTILIDNKGSQKIIMKKIFAFAIFAAVITVAGAQETVYPAPPQNAAIALTHATIHVGKGKIINDGMVLFSNGKITDVRPTDPVAEKKAIDCK